MNGNAPRHVMAIHRKKVREMRVYSSTLSYIAMTFIDRVTKCAAFWAMPTPYFFSNEIFNSSKKKTKCAAVLPQEAGLSHLHSRYPQC